MLELKNRIDKILTVFHRHRVGEFTGIRRYFHKVLDGVIRMMMAAVAAFLLTALLIYLVRGFWFLYTSTPVGEQFISQFPDEAGFFASLSNKPILEFTFFATLIASQVCVIITACCQVLYISRCFYYSRGVIGKTGWAAGIAMLTAKFFQKTWMPIDYSIAFAATIVPVLCVLPYAFSLADSTLPEIGAVFRKSVIKQSYNSLKTAILRLQR